MKRELELYIHIPFCVQKCAYCDFLSGPAGKEEQEAYVQALMREICAASEEAKDCEVSSIFLGGGTPSVLGPEEVNRILETVRTSFRLRGDVEITMELNPGTIGKGQMESYQKAGITRLSIGLQSADDKELRTLGRIHTWQEFLDTFESARKAGFSNINVDLMSAIPGQTLESYETTLRRVCSLSPEHLSAYSLILEEGTLFWQWYEKTGHPNGHPPLPDEETERRMYERTKEILQAYGYERYEISNYAKKGKACRHNIGYWKRVPYLGFGVGAASLFKEQRWSNLRDRENYVKIWNENTPAEALHLTREDRQKLSEREAQEETMFLGLRMTEGVSEEEFAQRFHRRVEEIYGEEIRRLEREGLIERTQGQIALTDRGIDVSNRVMACFLQDEKEEETI
nr:radical SAM family heme chaperone HemW [uncultured Sellimonas sp.]